jgi:hypothetical protein
MPFDGGGFIRATPDPTPPRPSWLARLISALRGRARQPSPPPVLDDAVLRVLEEARGLIERREDWTQGTLETLRGERCAVGAVRIAADFLDYEAPGRLALSLLARVAASRGFTSIEAMNDRSRHGQVLAAFDEAIAAARFRFWSSLPPR